jgi:hypothetical protein
MMQVSTRSLQHVQLPTLWGADTDDNFESKQDVYLYFIVMTVAGFRCYRYAPRYQASSSYATFTSPHGSNIRAVLALESHSW